MGPSQAAAVLVHRAILVFPDTIRINATKPINIINDAKKRESTIAVVATAGANLSVPGRIHARESIVFITDEIRSAHEGIGAIGGEIARCSFGLTPTDAAATLALEAAVRVLARVARAGACLAGVSIRW